MSRARSMVDRLVVALLGLVLVLAGGAVLGHRFALEPVAGWTARLRVPQVTDWPGTPWWPWALAATALVAGVSGLVLLALNLSGRRVPKLSLPASDDSGALTADPTPIAAAAAQALADIPGVHRAGHSAHLDRGVPTLDLVAHCDPGVDLDSLAEASRVNSATLAQALPGSGLVQRVLVRVDRSAGDSPDPHAE